MATWPGTLPQRVQAAGYSEQPPGLLLKTEMDAGEPKRRRRYTAGEREIAVVVRCTAAQAEILDAFFLDTVASGALPFTWVHPRTQAAADMYMTQPRYTPIAGGLRYDASFTLELKP